jgi:hypothetical protein
VEKVTSIVDFFNFGVLYKNSNPIQELFLEDLILYIIKGYQPFISIKNVWLKRLVLHQCGQVTFPSRQQLGNEVIPSMVNKTMEHHVLPTLANAITVIATFDMWMLRGCFNTFVLVVNYINKKREPCHVIVGIFEVHETLGLPWMFNSRICLFNTICWTKS